MKLREFASLVAGTIREWQEDEASRLAAALAFYTTFSLTPMLLLVIAIAALLGRQAAAQGLERMEQTKYAVRETSGAISIVPEPAAEK